MIFWIWACNSGYDGKQVQLENEPSSSPSSQPEGEPSSSPTEEPSSPSEEPSEEPSQEPSSPAQEPTSEPSSSPTSEPETPFEPIDSGAFTYTSRSIVPINGFIDFSVPLSAQATSIMLSIRGKEESIIYEVVSPNGDIVFSANDWYSTNQMLTEAIYTSQTGERAFNWPVRSIDQPLYEGEWDFAFFTNDPSSTPAQIDIMIKQDAQLYSGTLNVMIAHTNDMNYVQDYDTVLDDAITIWRNIYAVHGISLNIEFFGSNMSGDIPSPFEGSIDYYSLNGQGNEQDILVVIGENIQGVSEQFGVAGSIPGTTTRHQIGAIAISWLYAAGPDGEFDSIDKQLLGETLAHEVGHYLGLPHVVEQNWARFDALSDTPTCSSVHNCESLFETNLMFPYPICDTQSCTPQTTISTDQVGVMHRYVGVD